MEVFPILALEDNYMYVLQDTANSVCAVVDPVEPQKLIQFVRSRRLKLNAVITTHHHSDHAGGNTELASLLSADKVPFYAGDNRIPALTHKVADGDSFQVGQLHIRCIHTPCHTSGSTCYFVTHPSGSVKPLVFTGDTLFIAGCGRFFEGDAQQMFNSLNKLAVLPPDTLVYCGHEYTAKNLRFAKQVEPGNARVQEKLAWAESETGAGRPTVPSTLADELATNPFLRFREEGLKRHTGLRTEIDVLRELRAQKDKF